MAKKNKKTELGLLTKKQEKQLQDMVNGMLHKNSIVKIDEITTSNPVRGSIRVTDSLGKIWWVNKEDIANV